MNDTTDPFYTSLRAGEYTAKKPSGHPCDAVYKCKKLTTASKIGIAITVVVVVLFGGCQGSPRRDRPGNLGEACYRLCC